MHRMTNRGLGVLLAAALLTALLAPAAAAGRYGPRRHRDRPVPVIVEHHSHAGAVLGFLGGLVLGSVIASAEPAPPVPVCERGGPGYDYYDPWCHLTFGSLARYEEHLDRHRHPCTAEVVDARSGDSVDTVRWRDGRWISDEETAERYGPVGSDDAPAYEEWDD